MTPSPADPLVEELRAERQRQDVSHGETDAHLDAGDWITLLVKRLGRVGDEALRLSQAGMRRELLSLAALALACIEQIDRRLAPRSPR